MTFGRYNAPGVFTESIAGPVLGTLSSTPNAIGIFGDSIRYLSDVETIEIPTDTNVTTPAPSVALRRLGVDGTSVKVYDPASGTTYIEDTDYTLVSVAGSDSGSTRDDTYKIQRVIAGALDANTRVEVSYQYTENSYFEPVRFYDNDDVEDFYGKPFDADGNIVSELSLASRFAFLNGASSVICVAVDAAGTTPTTTEYATALEKLSEEQDVAIVVAANGGDALHSYIKAHVDAASSQSYERRAIVGRDGSVTAVSSSDRITSAKAIANKRVAHVSPATVSYYNSDMGAAQTIGGHFLAAALAGLSLSASAAQPLTRRQVQGFYEIPESMTNTQKNLEAEAGLLIVEKSRLGGIRVRHGVTTDPTTILTREWSITGQEDAMAYRIRDALDADGIIGSVISDLTLINVKASADAALQGLVGDGTILSYRDLKVRQLASSPDVIEVRYEWQAAVPLNYIVVRYSVSVTTGETTTLTS